MASDNSGIEKEKSKIITKNDWISNNRVITETAWEGRANSSTAESISKTPLRVQEVNPVRGKSFFYFAADDPWRRGVYNIVSHAYTVRFILFCIFLNVAILAIEGPTGSWLPHVALQIFDYLDLVITIIFTIEMFMWMFALGLVVGDGTYLKQAWFRLDFIVVISAWISVASLPGLGFSFQAFRALRALRPLRALKFFAGIRAILESLRQSFELLVDVGILLMFFFVFFGITGIQLFGNSMTRRCTMTDESKFPDMAGQIANPPRWCGTIDQFGLSKGFQCGPGQTCLSNATVPNEVTSFDNIGYAILTIFQCISLEGWTNIMYSLQDAEYVIAWMYFVFMIVIISFFVVNLFVAVISATFARVREKEHRSAFAQRVEDDAETLIVRTDYGWKLQKKQAQDADSASKWWDKVSWYFLPPNYVSKMQTVITSPQFEALIIIAIILNTVFLALEKHGQSPEQAFVLYVAEFFFTFFFCFEMLCKLAGLGVIGYFRDLMNRFDFVVVVITVASLFVDLDNYAVLRVGRLLRLSRLIPKFPSLKKLVDTVLRSLVGLVNLLAFMTFSLIVFAILGMQLFGEKFPASQRINFNTFFDALLALFVVMTGENWVDVMFSAMRADELSKYLAPPFFIIFFVFANYILLNLFIAVILENFEYKQAEKLKKQIELFNHRIREQQFEKPNPVHALLVRFYRKIELAKAREARTLNVTTLPHGYVAEIQRKTVDKFVTDASGVAATPFTQASHAPTHHQSVRSISPAHRKEVIPAWVPTHLKGKDRKKSKQSLTAAFDGGIDLSVLGKEGSKMDVHSSVWADEDESLTVHANRSLNYKATIGRTPKTRDENTQQKNVSLFGRQASFANTIPASPLSVLEGSDTHSDTTHGDKGVEMHGEEKEVLSREGTEVYHQPSKLHMKQRMTVSEQTEARYNVSLFCMPENNVFRKTCLWIVDNNVFETFIMIVIIVSSIFLALEFPGAREDPFWSALFNIADLVFLIIFTTEFALKVIGFGFMMTPHAYLRDGWNILDFTVVIASWLSYFFQSGNATIVRSFRTLRALRPLRLITVNAGMKVIIDSLAQSLPAILNVVFLWLFFLITFGILGVNLFSGKFYRCNDNTVETRAQCVGNFVDPTTHVLVPRSWTSPPYSFDDILSAVLTLFEVGSLEGWIRVMHAGVDASTIDHQPILNNHPENAIYFVIFIFLGSFFVVKLFVGALVTNFWEYNGSALLTSEQKQWVDIKRVMLGIRPVKRPPRPSNRYRAMMYDWIRHPKFEQAVTVFILGNLLLMATESTSQPDSWTEFLDIGNWFFVSIFFIEMVIKMTGLGLKHYFKSAWNVFDCVVTMGSIVLPLIPNFPMSTAFIRALRVLRITRIIRSAKGLRTLFNTLVTSLPSMGNLASLFLIIFFMYAVVGVSLFGRTRFGKYSNSRNNFRNFSNALLVLFRMVTGEDWNMIMHDYRVTDPDCVLGANDLAEDDCGWPTGAILYFVSFYLVGAYVFLNLFIAVILENFSYCYNQEENTISDEALTKYQEIFLKFDPDSKGYLKVRKLRDFVTELGPPLGFDVSLKQNKSEFHSLMLEIRHLAKEDKGVSFRHLLHILALRCVGMKSLEHTERVGRAKRLAILLNDVASTRITAVARGFLLRRRDVLRELRRERNQRQRDRKEAESEMKESRLHEKLSSAKMKLRTFTMAQKSLKDMRQWKRSQPRKVEGIAMEELLFGDEERKHRMKKHFHFVEEVGHAIEEEEDVEPMNHENKDSDHDEIMSTSSSESVDESKTPETLSHVLGSDYEYWLKQLNENDEMESDDLDDDDDAPIPSSTVDDPEHDKLVQNSRDATLKWMSKLSISVDEEDKKTVEDAANKNKNPSMSPSPKEFLNRLVTSASSSTSETSSPQPKNVKFQMTPPLSPVSSSGSLPAPSPLLEIISKSALKSPSDGTKPKGDGKFTATKSPSDDTKPKGDGKFTATKSPSDDTASTSYNRFLKHVKEKPHYSHLRPSKSADSELHEDKTDARSNVTDTPTTQVPTQHKHADHDEISRSYLDSPSDSVLTRYHKTKVGVSVSDDLIPSHSTPTSITRFKQNFTYQK